MITESDRIAEALANAEQIWPDLRSDRGALLRLILETGMQEIAKQAKAANPTRLNAIGSSAGSLDGVWPANWREELRDEWPA
jgi:hypothetical protein